MKSVREANKFAPSTIFMILKFFKNKKGAYHYGKITT